MRIALIGFVAASLAAGCASISEKECRSGDWRELGRQDGARGLSIDGELSRHHKACAGHGISPDATAYRSGHAEGLAQYCQPAGGYVAARRGEPYREVCPADSAQFREAFRRGREVSRMLEEARDLRRRIDDARLRAMTDDDVPEDRTNLRFRAEDLEQRLRQKEWELERLDRRYARLFGAPELGDAELRY